MLPSNIAEPTASGIGRQCLPETNNIPTSAGPPSRPPKPARPVARNAQDRMQRETINHHSFTSFGVAVPGLRLQAGCKPQRTQHIVLSSWLRAFSISGRCVPRVVTGTKETLLLLTTLPTIWGTSAAALTNDMDD